MSLRRDTTAHSRRHPALPAIKISSHRCNIPAPRCILQKSNGMKHSIYALLSAIYGHENEMYNSVMLS